MMTTTTTTTTNGSGDDMHGNRKHGATLGRIRTDATDHRPANDDKRKEDRGKDRGLADPESPPHIYVYPSPSF